MVAGESVAPFEADALARAEHEGAALLDRASPARPLAEAARERGNALEDAEGVQGSHPATREGSGLEDAQRRVGEDWPVIAGGSAKSGDVLGSTTADHDEAPTRADPWERRYEASDLLAAEDSAEVADEGKHGWLARPEAPEGDRYPVLVERGQ